MAEERQIPVTKKQKQAVENMLSGKFKSKSAALQAAGYTGGEAGSPARFMQATGVRQYLKRIGKKAKKLFKMKLEDKVMQVYMEGLNADKPFGKDAIMAADHPTRKMFADRFSEFFGWTTEAPATAPVQTQNNFFMVAKEEQKEFNGKFKDFLRGFYSPEQK